MEGEISLGVYDATGKLVRILHREAEPGELVKGDDGLETQWDGRDEQGKPCPAGTYRARGVLVGDLGVEGVDFIGNDWVTDDDSPRVRRITSLGMSASGTPFIIASTLGQPQPMYYSIVLKLAPAPGEDPEAQLVPEPATPSIRVPIQKTFDGLTGLKSKACAGFNDTEWTIEGKIVKQYSREVKVIRTLLPQSDDPPPVKLTVSENEDKIYVLYENATLQRLRGYDFTGVKPGGEPKVLFEQDIRASDTYEQIASELKFPDEQPFVPSPTLTVALAPNPLAHNKPGTLQIRAGVDKEGCYLATADGLPLTHISDTEHLRWAVLGQPAGSKSINVFDGDGAVVEEFQISKIDQMMAFDAGVIQWPGETRPIAAPLASPASAAKPAANPAAPLP